MDVSSSTAVPVRTSGPFVLLRLEGLAFFATAISFYARDGYSWILFAVLFLVPDVSFLGYLRGPRVGSLCYNLVHNYVFPLLLAGVLLIGGRSLAVPLIWIAHIGFDRMLGYGLKYSTGFGDTHLGRIRRGAQKE
jgi:hypothetical protein